MSRIEWTAPMNVAASSQHTDEVRAHSAWKGDLSEEKAALLLQGKPSYTYLLRSEGKEGAYIASFVKFDGTIYHQSFIMKEDVVNGWHFKNGMVKKREVIADSLIELIPSMMLCDHTQCRPLKH